MKCSFLCVLSLLLLLLTPPVIRADNRLQTVTLQLKWTHAFQFAGYYTALEKGYYREAGLDVRIVEGQPGSNPADAVLRGEAQYGIGNTCLLLRRSQGQPVVVLGVIFQHSPMVILARKTGPTQSIHDLAGKRLMLEPETDELTAYLNKEGLKDKVTLVEHRFDMQPLLDGSVDAMAAFVYDEPHQLEHVDFAYALFNPRSAGIDFYGDNLFTTEAEIRQHPRRAEAFRAASLRGWQYAMAHPEEIIHLILAKYPTRQDRGALLHEARQMKELMQPDLIEVGYMHPGRWRHIADTYAELGMLPGDFRLEGFLYQPDPFFRYDLLLRWSAGILVVLTVSVWLMIRFSRIARKARQSEQRHRLLADNVTDVIWTLDLEGRFTYVSPSVKKLRGYTPEEVMRGTLLDTLTPESATVAKQKLIEFRKEVRSGSALRLFRGELEQPCKGGGTVWTEVNCAPLVGADGTVVGIVGVTRDISERKRMEAELRRLATTDPLTGAYNRRFLYEKATQELERSRRFKQPLSFLLVDIDWFKRINDAHGHDIGDEVLKTMSRACMGLLRSIDLFSRLGGEEFGILLVNTGREGGHVFAERLRHHLEQLEVACPGGPIRFTVSIGLAVSDDTVGTVNDLIKQADLALYVAKANGRNRVESAGSCRRSPQPAGTSLSAVAHLIWDDLMCCGQPTIDEQHRRLFALANQLLDTPWPGENGQLPDVAPVEAFLAEITAHFHDEESLLRTAGYQEVSEHAKLHLTLVNQARALLEQCRNGSLLPGDLSRFIVQDLMHNHMLRDDTRFYPLFANPPAHAANTSDHPPVHPADSRA
ncbi:diguanylate cyclase with PAS/PAC sensor and hemerythrin-like metal-binding domain protein [Desulfobulbus propionicus DSM 2032]|uniref:Diguanylate cyclase with PAS/PAC sensor and hemerythrin-like metal-binding domain protein n=1 Tax=Desulfobulbus propionicus (strain ATCC 33891 / DSM 2032 / VKM B-1956 / 1pr3) TaxID=577650 RepID=A0A7U3YM54_DESPD|nr:ABC transporter substrate-binding protein [Desulfobulbus propionicus]ADW17910.1 diguanylate cyclase with PAS/PAC sensor and hemerythrin-like metal-binding domain protein [Desulfobulbus propionicus DSM 2032]